MLYRKCLQFVEKACSFSVDCRLLLFLLDVNKQGYVEGCPKSLKRCN